MNKKVFLSIVSHNNDDIILKNFSSIPRLIGDYNIVISIIDNIGSNNLKSKAEEFGFNYYSDDLIRGYGGNNNLNFTNLNPKNDDIFIVCNPDIQINIDSLEDLLNHFVLSKADIYGVKVFEAKDFSKWSSHNRSFPGLLDPLVSLVFKLKLFENEVDAFSNPDWIGGAFMIFNPKSFRKLGGFDEDFFMYYEDTDICYRAKMMKMNIIYNPDFFIIHDAQRAGRKLFSKAFFMNFKSMITYFYKHPTLKLLTLKWKIFS